MQFLLPVLSLTAACSAAQPAATNPDSLVTKGDKAPFFIDKFFVPAAALDSFKTRMKINRDFIKTLPGFIEDRAYEYLDEQGNLTCITVASWASTGDLGKARDAVQAKYKQEGFDIAAMMSRLNIRMERGIYHEAD